MLKQTYSQSELAKVITTEDLWKRNLWDSEMTKDEFLRNCNKIINADDFEISAFYSNKRNGKITYQLSKNEDWIALKKTDFYLRRIYKVKPSDRNLIIKQIKILLKDQGKLQLIRMDIKSFGCGSFAVMEKFLKNNQISIPLG